MVSRIRTRLDALERKIGQPDPPRIYVCWCDGDDHSPECPCYGEDLAGVEVVTVGIDLEGI